MPRISRETRVRQWTQRLERFQTSGLSVKQFCLDEGVSQPSFYQWKNKIQARDSDASQGRTDTKNSRMIASVFKSVDLLPATTSAQRCTTIRLADGVEIELGDNLQIVDRVVQAVLKETVHRQNAQSGAPTC